MPIDRRRRQFLRTDGTTVIDRAFLAHFQVSAANAPAVDADGVLALTSLGAAAQVVTADINDPAVPRGLSIVGNLSGIAGNVVIAGTSFAGEVISETVALNGTGTVNGNKAFRTVTSVTLPAQTHTPTLQQETLPVTNQCTQAGVLVVTVTAAGMTNSPKAVEVEVTAADNTTALVAAKIRAALAADVNVGAFFTVGGTAANVLLTAKAFAANDGTMEMAMVDAPDTGVTVGSSINTTAGVLGVAQQETIDVTAGSGGVGTLVFTVTAAGMTGSPKAVNVAVTGDDDQVGEVATKIRAALTADANVGAFFTVGGTGADILITAKVKAANDGTMLMALTDADGTGVTVGASVNTTAGVLPVLQKETITVTHKADGAGVLVWTVTAANMPNSPVSVDVWVDENDSTVTLVGNKVRAALAADVDIGGFFTVSGSAGEINLTAKTDAADDGTMLIALTDAPTTAVTVDASANTTAGVPVDRVSVGWNDKLGLPFKLSHNTVIPGMTFLNNTREGTEPTVTVSATAIESNTIDLNSALNGTIVDSYLAV